MSAASAIEQVARAVLYEGFLLYPYRLSSVKNRQRWNFGVLFPEPYADTHAERSLARTECLVEALEAPQVNVKVRFLQCVDGGAPVEREIAATALELTGLADQPHESEFTIGGSRGVLAVSAEAVGEKFWKLGVQISSLARYNGEDRDAALAGSFISAHILMTVRGGRFISSIDPPEPLKAAVAQCRNVGLWPVLADGSHTGMLSAPVILYDQPQVAPQSPGDLFDATEIDEILTLRIQTLTDAEKTEMRAADPRARTLLERSEALSREELFNLHAAMRGNARHLFKRGDRVRLQPRRRADIFDIALAGKLATVVSVEQDFDDGVHVCVTVDDDPGRDLGEEGKPGHRFFFGTEELEPA